MKHCPPPKVFDVFEFKDDEHKEFETKLTYKRRPRKRNRGDEFPNFKEGDISLIRKYPFLKTYSSSVKPEGKKMSSILCVDVETSDSSHKCKDNSVHTPGIFDGRACAVKDGNFGSDEIPVSSSVSHREDDEKSDSCHKCKDHGAHTLGTFDDGDYAVKEGNFGLEIPVSSSVCYREDADTNPYIVESGNLFPICPSVRSLGASCWNEIPLSVRPSSPGVPSPGDGQIHSNLVELPSNNNLLDVISDDGSVTCSSDIREDQEDSGLDHYSDGWEMGNVNMEVVFSPDYVVYKDIYCTDSSLSFASSCIKLEGINAYGSKQVFCFEWGIADVISIESQWYARSHTAMVKLSLSPIADLDAEIRNVASGNVEMKFAVYDPHWLGRQHKIMSMDDRYEAIWRVLPDPEEIALGGKNQMFHIKGYFPILDEPFEDVIYPKGDPDAVSISKRDVELLQPETFINDTIIDFYVKFLKNKIKPEDRNRFHFFNSFFFRKLADLDKNPSSASEGRAAFLRVRKWTRKVNLFEKDYVFIPVNFNLHWSLIVICHPGEVATFKDEKVDKSLKVPCILHMDSIKGSHKGLINLIQGYLWEEWRERQAESSEDVSSNFTNLRFVPLELPQQENSFDCGLFLLHYVELFLEEAPVYFNPFKLSKVSNFLNLNWFPPAQASLKRVYIQKLVYELLQDQSVEVPCAGRDKDRNSLQSFESNSETENGLEFLLDGQIAANPCNSLSSCPVVDQSIEIKLLGTPGTVQYVRDSGLVLKELFEPGTNAVSPPGGKFRSFEQITSVNKFKAAMTPIKEDEEGSEQFAFSPSGGTGYRQLAGYTLDGACTTSHSLKAFGIYDALSNSIIPMTQNGDAYDKNSSSEGHSCNSQSSSDLMVNGGDLPGGLWCPNGQEETKKSRSMSVENDMCISESPSSEDSEGLDTHIVEDSQEVDGVAIDDEKKRSPSRFQENFYSSSHLGVDEDLGENLEMNADVNTSERAAKRTKLTLTGSLTMDWEI